MMRTFVCLMALCSVATAGTQIDVKQLDRERVLAAANKYLAEEPVTVTASKSPRSAGGLHDFHSEGDYWWPDPKNPDGPYIQKDGQTNPDNFVAHRHAMVRMSMHVGALTSAYRITGDEKYARHAIKHFRAWFVDEPTRMNPNLQYAQAIKGITTGRGIGIIDTLHLVEPARAACLLQQAGLLKENDLTETKKWFTDYTTWMTTSKNGLDEMKAENNHGTCWVLQVAAFASFTGDEEKLAMCRQRYKEILLPNQMAADGSFPRELKRTKPYGYSLFNADAMAAVCWICSTPQEDLFKYETPDGKSMCKGVAWIAPFIADKSKWPKPPDVMYHEFWPVRSPVLLFGGITCDRPKWLETWKKLDANPTNEEVLRNLPIREPVLWVE
ncbi:MAG: hypothetical protein QOE14_649 [Humisphaera sp.]|nr:hypothetical protein [Humisphaera sp.]